MIGFGSTASSIVSSAGGSVIMAAPLAGPAAPIVAAVGGLIVAGAQIAGMLHIGEGCGDTCKAATQVVNQAEPAFRMNLQGYEDGIIPQDVAQNNFAQMWQAIQQACGGIPGAAGSKCVSDRQSGACVWRQTAAPKYPGQPNVGECWNWWNAYHDPLTYPALVPYTDTSVTGRADSIVSTVTSNPMLLVAGGLILFGLMSSGGKD